MAKMWVDPPSGWRYGFPKVWDSEEEPDVDEWLRKNGYPPDESATYVRMWEYVEPAQEVEKGTIDQDYCT